MKVFLMYRERDFHPEHEITQYEQDLIQDLGLDVLFETMSGGSEYLLDVVRSAVLSCETEVDTILYRQGVLKDCIRNADVVREIYGIAVDAIENRRKHHLGIFSITPSTILSGSVGLLKMLLEMLKRLKGATDKYSNRFESDGFKQFFGILKQELTDEFFAEADRLLRELKFEDGVMVRAQLTKGNEGSNYTLVRKRKRGWLENVFSKVPLGNASSYTFKLHPRDDSGFRALSEIKDRAVNPVANTIAQSADHVLGFFEKLRREVAFYIGALNLYEKLSALDEPVAFPIPVASGEFHHSFRGLYDPCLAVSMNGRVVGNTLNLHDKKFSIITGANQGGKSTFLRSIGVAQILMQCGMFVPAEYFSANVCSRVFTHFVREEDKEMESGKLEEELRRMDSIIEEITPNSMVLFNESFASTNEREGSEIARQVVSALVEADIKLFFVTHMYEFANYFYTECRGDVTFLVAERKDDGTRTFRIVEGKPSATSYGRDLYERILAPLWHSDNKVAM